MAASDALERFTAAAADAGVTVAACRYPEGTRTAADAAAAVGCDVAQIVKSLVLSGPDGPLLVLTAGSSQVDLEALGALVDGPVRMATPDEVRTATGYAIGGTPPFGHPTALPTLIDPVLLDHDIVHAAAGTPDSCFAIDPETLRDVTAADGAAVFA
jgi:prolyl-tRNA editing enzyme YbaK/EbsC (Cys-tRNA(Pro) deacylase)